mmetsp:Transcript_26698/g.68588  ORF Transcript_26698/g.68588 Transcript_26698/m.68588 type:complete len:261 (-) Transcript_26698:2038-2820(-)
MDHVHFTGSNVGGKSVLQSVAASSKWMGIGTELGGNDAAIVLSDVGADCTVASSVVDGGMYNGGQSCCAVERVFVEEAVHDRFVENAAAVVSQYVMGDPLSVSTTMGPLATEKQVNVVQRQVDEAVAMGAKVVVGGKRDGPFFEPTLLTNVTSEMEIMQEETFGPVLAIEKVKGCEQAIRHANDSKFGLTASIWTQDSSLADIIAKQLNVGTVYFNRCDVLDPLLPWSGRGETGVGVGLSKYSFLPLVHFKAINGLFKRE